MIPLRVFALAVTLSTITSAQSAPRGFDFRFDGHIYVPVVLGDTGRALLVLDPISGLMLDRTSAQRRGIVLLGGAEVGYGRPVQAGGAGSARHEITFARNLAVRAGNVPITRPLVPAIPLDSMMAGSFDHRVDGLIGLDAFASFILKLDFARERASVYDTAGFVVPDNAIALPFEVLPGGKPVLRVAVTLPDGRVIPLRAVADIGMEAAMRVSTRVTDSLKLLSAFPSAVPDSSFTGLGGSLTSLMARVPQLSLGSARLTNVVTALARETDGADANPPFDVFLGLEVFRRFDTYIDWPERMFYLVPTASVTEPFVDAPLGLEFAAMSASKELEVLSVAAGSLATAAGLRVGDTIVAVGEESTRGWTRYRLETALRRYVNSSVSLKIRREGSELRLLLRVQNRT